jgi:hypothetical protein
LAPEKSAARAPCAKMLKPISISSRILYIRLSSPSLAVVALNRG